MCNISFRLPKIIFETKLSFTLKRSTNNCLYKKRFQRSLRIFLKVDYFRNFYIQVQSGRMCGGGNSTVPILCFVLYMNSIYKCAREKQSQKWYCKNVANLAGYYRTFYMYLYYVRAIAFWNKDVRSCWYARRGTQTFHPICLNFPANFHSNPHQKNNQIYTNVYYIDFLYRFSITIRFWYLKKIIKNCMNRHYAFESEKHLHIVPRLAKNRIKCSSGVFSR